MDGAHECYQRLMDAQHNRPSDDEMKAWEAGQRREAMNAKIKRRLPKVV